MTRNRHGTLGVIAFLAFGLLAAGYALLALSHRLDENAATIKQLSATVVGEQQALQAQLLLVQALQQQVRDLGGQPLTSPPTPRTPPRTPVQPTGPDASATPTAGPSRSVRPTPRPSPSRSPSASPSPSPSSSFCPVQGVCLPPAGH